MVVVFLQFKFVSIPRASFHWWYHRLITFFGLMLDRGCHEVGRLKQGAVLLKPLMWYKSENRLNCVFVRVRGWILKVRLNIIGFHNITVTYFLQLIICITFTITQSCDSFPPLSLLSTVSLCRSVCLIKHTLRTKAHALSVVIGSVPAQVIWSN